DVDKVRLARRSRSSASVPRVGLPSGPSHCQDTSSDSSLNGDSSGGSPKYGPRRPRDTNESREILSPTFGLSSRGGRALASCRRLRARRARDSAALAARAEREFGFPIRFGLGHALRRQPEIGAQGIRGDAHEPAGRTASAAIAETATFPARSAAIQARAVAPVVTT